MSPQLDPTAERLIPGLPLLFSEPALRTPGRVALSDGVTDLGGQHRQGKDYRPTAYVPAAPWRLPTAAEFALLCPRAAAEQSSFVGLVKLPEAALAALAEQGRPDRTARPDPDHGEGQNGQWLANPDKWGKTPPRGAIRARGREPRCGVQ